MNKNAINGLPSFDVDVNLTIPSEPSAVKRIEDKVLMEKDEFYNFNEDFYDILKELDSLTQEDRDQLINVDYSPSEYFLAIAKINSGPENYDGYKFTYPINLKGIDFNDPKVVTSDIGIVSSRNVKLETVNAVMQVINSLLIERGITKYAVKINVFLDNEHIFAETIEKNEFT